MRHFSRSLFTALPSYRLALAAAFALPTLAGAVAEPLDCDRVKSPEQPVRLTLFELNPADPLRANDREAYIDIDRSDPRQTVLYSHFRNIYSKSVLTKNMLPLSMSVPARNVFTRFEYGGEDLSKLRFEVGKVYSFASRSIARTGEISPILHDYVIADGGRFSVAGCAYHVLDVHHVMRMTSGTVELVTTLDSLYAPELGFVLRSHSQSTRDGKSVGDTVMMATGIDLLPAPPAGP